MRLEAAQGLGWWHYDAEEVVHVVRGRLGLSPSEPRLAGALPVALLQAGCGMQKRSCWSDYLHVITPVPGTRRGGLQRVDGGGEVRNSGVLGRVRLLALSDAAASTRHTDAPPYMEEWRRRSRLAALGVVLRRVAVRSLVRCSSVRQMPLRAGRAQYAHLLRGCNGTVPASPELLGRAEAVRVAGKASSSSSSTTPVAAQGAGAPIDRASGVGRCCPPLFRPEEQMQVTPRAPSAVLAVVALPAMPSLAAPPAHTLLEHHSAPNLHPRRVPPPYTPRVPCALGAGGGGSVAAALLAELALVLPRLRTHRPALRHYCACGGTAPNPEWRN